MVCIALTKAQSLRDGPFARLGEIGRDWGLATVMVCMVVVTILLGSNVQHCMWKDKGLEMITPAYDAEC